MSDVMRQIPFGQMMDWILSEYAADGSIFGVRNLYRHNSGEALSIFGEKFELPFGPAAGPHTQLAQNLVASYVAGSRFFELKTVQTLDGEDLPVSKPCIAAKDECYNVEWSTELYVPQALDEYIKGWFAIKLLSYELGLGDPNAFVFNMSVGYDLEGIKSKKIDDFIEGLKNASATDSWKRCKQWAFENLDRFGRIDAAYIEGLNPCVCRSITLSTLHGCPPAEIERIAEYLLTEKGLHTFIKCNPTLLGYEYARQTLDKLGFDYVSFDDHHFKADMQFEDAVPMLRRLQTLADGLSLTFGVKLTNTLPVKITEGELPGDEMYMSGRSLFPLSIELANRLSKAFDGKLRVSFSGGTDARNIGELCDTGIQPVTMATTLLKPGGYHRLRYAADALKIRVRRLPADIDLVKLQKLAETAQTDKMYHKPIGRAAVRKLKTSLPLLDCFAAPCREGCPFNQDIPAYLRLAGEGRFLEALRVITERNPLPFITGTICSHHCFNKCTRGFYEGGVNIRAVKLEAAQKAFGDLLKEIKPVPKTGGKVAVIGGGPTGLAAAYFLAKAGRPVVIFEKTDSLGGIVKHIIPEFRIGDDAISNDIDLIRAMGVDIRTNCEIRDIHALAEEGFEQIIVAVGAWKPGVLRLEGGEAIGALEFLARLKRDRDSVDIGENIVVIGGGNTAMDAARAAKRVPGVRRVSLVYRRTRRQMPAETEEIELALNDGVEFCELLAPVSFRDGVLHCDKMKLGAPDTSGRRSPVTTGETADIPADTVISAIGDSVDGEMLASFGIETDERGKAVFNSETMETGRPGVYLAGDAARGPATVADSIADAMRCARAITGADMDKYSALNVNDDIKAVESKKGVLYSGSAASGAAHNAERCLECATRCGNCVDVCPNRANIMVAAGGGLQIVHMDYMCNECGNCETFCPYSSAPYLDKFTIFACEEDFSNSNNAGFYPLGDGVVRVRLDGETADHRLGESLPDGICGLVMAVLEKDWLLFRNGE